VLPDDVVDDSQQADDEVGGIVPGVSGIQDADGQAADQPAKPRFTRAGRPRLTMLQNQAHCPRQGQQGQRQGHHVGVEITVQEGEIRETR
jgi:hypothetical protein